MYALSTTWSHKPTKKSNREEKETVNKKKILIDLRSNPLTSGIERRWIRNHSGTSLGI